MSHHARHHQ